MYTDTISTHPVEHLMPDFAMIKEGFCVSYFAVVNGLFDKRVFPNFYILGWYSTGADAEESDMQIHKSEYDKEADNQANKAEISMTRYSALSLAGIVPYLSGELLIKKLLSPDRASLSVSSGFGDQFLKLFSNSSLVSIVKDSADADITNLPPIPEIVTKTLVSTVVPSPQVTPIISTVQQRPTPIPTPPITIDTTTIITAVHESNAFFAVELRSQVPIVVDSYLDTKVRDAFQKEPQKHPADLIHKYSLQHLPELTKKPTPTSEQESEKIPSDILKIKKEQPESQKNPVFHYDLRQGLLKEYDLKEDTRRKADDYEDDDDEDPLAGLNQGKAPTKRSKTGKSASAKELVEEPITEVVMDDAGNDVSRDDYQPQDTSEAKTRKTLNPEWFKQPPRPPTLNPEWNKHHDPLTFNDLMATRIDFSKYVLNGLKIENLTQDILLRPAFNLLKGTCSSSIELKYNFQECFNAFIDKLNWNNPEGDRYPFDLSKPLPLQGPPGHRTIAADYFFNNDLAYLKTSDPEVTYTTSITKTKVARYEIKGIKDMVLTLWSTIKHAYDKDAEKGIKH
ncbi:hypothetical protein Tco_1056929 [Tanacetum coccineum]|uniref:JAB1/MPN/MOV34 metalloenzyme domain-containing protein n=1 Tax=Tanacetum coccineum TaxID=301880 RepID=A0ABQ5H5R1_9ASTR